MILFSPLSQALHPRDKSLRACYRAAFYECALYDHSYECVIEVAGAQERIVAAFRALMAPGGAASPASLAYDLVRVHMLVRLFVLVYECLIEVACAQENIVVEFHTLMAHCHA